MSEMSEKPPATDAAAHGVRFWVLSLAAALLMTVTASLGFWQLGRAQTKLNLQAAIESRAVLPPLDEAGLLAGGAPEELVHRQAQIRGVWVPAATVFLDNRPMAGRSGFFVITPLQLAGTSDHVLVQRGWVPRDFQDRTRVPAIPTPAGEVLLRGRLAPPPSKLFELGEAGGGAIRQNIDVAAYARETGLALLNVSLLQTGAANDGLQRDWPRLAADVHKHHGYAFQWFGLCALTGFLYVWFQIIAPRRRSSAQRP